jgi:hypothetical protein
MPPGLCTVLSRPKACRLKDFAAFYKCRAQNKKQRPYILTVDRFRLGLTPTYRRDMLRG